MNTQQLVVLYGDSLLLDSVEASLASDHYVSVMRLRAATPEMAERLCDRGPDLLSYDRDASHFRGLVPFLKTRPSVPLLGLDVNVNKVISLTSTVHTVDNQEELKRVVEHYVDAIVPDVRTEVTPLGTAQRGAIA